MHNGPSTLPSDGQFHGWLVADSEQSDGEDEGRSWISLGPVDRAAGLNDALAEAADPSDRWLVLSIDPGVDFDQVPVVSDPGVGLVANPACDAGPVDWADAVARWLDQDSTTGSCLGPNAAVMVRVAATLAVGGFDETATGLGLGLADLITRLVRAGWSVTGVPSGPIGRFDLEPLLTARARVRSAAVWHRRYSGPDDLDRFRKDVLKAAARASVRSNPEAKDILSDGKRRWPQPRPDESQQGVGIRADWRFLVPRTGAEHLLIVDAAFEPAEGVPHFLQADGWAEQVTVGLPTRGRSEDPADVIFIGLQASVGRVLDHAAADGWAVVELGRSPLGRLSRIRALRATGYRPTAHYLVTPDLASAKRYVRLSAGAIGWLLAQPPPVAGTRSGPARAAVGLGLRAIAAVISVLASAPYGSVVAGAGAQGLVVAQRSSGPPVDPEPSQPQAPTVLMTSGHDEGSRAIMINRPETNGPAGRAVAPKNDDGPEVVKMSPRPGYNHNTEAEAEVITAIRSRLATVGDRDHKAAAAALLPVVKPPVTVGNLRGARESYAGRWTATDLCNRMPTSRPSVLTDVLRAIDRFGAATTSSTTDWSADHYEHHIGALFRLYRNRIGWRPTFDALESMLVARSEALIGSPIPLVQRHYDLGPWNVVYADDGDGLTFIDWELAPPRAVGQDGLGGVDQLYFVKYWLHIAMETRSLDDELAAFPFLADPDSGSEARAMAAGAYRASLDRLNIDHRFVPLLAAHLWLEASLYTSTRRADHGGDPGSPARYLETLANRRVELFGFWS